jgi:Spy/CpxP family protein refolding chaperone
MNRNAFVKRVAVGAGFLLLCGAPRLSLGQASPATPTQASPATPAGLARPRAVPARRGKAISPTEYLAGLTLSDDQKAKINQIREETKTHLAAVAKDDKMGPEVKEAMLGGYQRIENGKIFEVLTPDQKKEVRKRLADLRASAQPSRPPLQQPPAPATNSQPSK